MLSWTAFIDTISSISVQNAQVPRNEQPALLVPAEIPTAPAQLEPPRVNLVLAEVFGFPSDVRTPRVEELRSLCLCPFKPRRDDAARDLSNEAVPLAEQFERCNKVSTTNPLGVCSIYADRAGHTPVITCPVRFTEGGLMTGLAANWIGGVVDVPADDLRSIPEVKLIPALENTVRELDEELDDEETAEQVPEVSGQSAGNIDYVLASMNVRAGSRETSFIDDYEIGQYGALEVQGVYISGNVREPFREFMREQVDGAPYVWSGKHVPRPDWLSSSRKRLVPQLAWKGGILRTWGKPIAVCIQRQFWNELRYLQAVCTEQSDELAWIIVDLVRDGDLFRLQHVTTEFAPYEVSLAAATRTPAGVDRIVRETLIKKALTQQGRNPRRRPAAR